MSATSPVLAVARLAVLVSLGAVAVVCAVVVAIGLLPVTLVAIAGVTLAWWQAWRPDRLYRAAAWCLPMTATWLAATAIASHSLAPVAEAPHLAWLAATQQRNYLAAATLVAPGAVPAGLLAGGWVWSRRLALLASGTAGSSPLSADRFDRAHWRRQVRAARARLAGLALLTARGEVVAGATIRVVGHHAGPAAAVPLRRLMSHQILLGETGTGKTTLMLRLWAAFLAAGMARHAAGLSPRPLLLVWDCKGGADARRMAALARVVLEAHGAATVAVWPDEAALSLWALPAGQLVTTLADLVEHGTGSAAYYADVLEAVVTLAVEAPAGPPASSADFLARLDPAWLAAAYATAGYESQLALVRATARQVADVALRYRAVFRRLGPGLDGADSLADADVWYCILEGTAQVAVAEQQARALRDLLTSYVTAPGAQRRQVLLAVDEFSAVARRVPIWELFERARSLGVAVHVSAQSWAGLAAGEDERNRLAATADGGIWLFRTPLPDAVVALTGQRAAIDAARELDGPLRWTGRGTSRQRPELVTDPEIVRRLENGQVAHLYRGGVTFAQVKPLLRAAPGPGPQAGPHSAPAHEPRPAEPDRAPAQATVLPDISALLDQAFGGGR